MTRPSVLQFPMGEFSGFGSVCGAASKHVLLSHKATTLLERNPAVQSSPGPMRASGSWEPTVSGMASPPNRKLP